jgi:coproporphyrinogen III oxidase
MCDELQVSAPPVVHWDYNFVPAAGSEEERLMGILRQPKQWI